MALLCVSAAALAAAHARAQDATAEQMIEGARERISPIRRCKPADDGTIVVCGSDTARDRLSPELRDVAGVGQSTRDSIPPAPEVKTMIWDSLPYNWVGTDGALFPRAKPNPLLEHVKAMEAARAAEERGRSDCGEQGWQRRDIDVHRKSEAWWRTFADSGRSESR